MKPDLTAINCPLCIGTDINKFHQDNRRDYLLCKRCSLVFVPPIYFLSEDEEKTEYDLHKNSPDDQGYRFFLSRLFIPMQERLSHKSHGLDFGCGPGPTLSLMFEETGHSMAIYDHFYAKNPSLLQKKYDFITTTEVVEHLHKPGKELNKLWDCLRPGGFLGIMTKLVINSEAFAHWHYKNDLTHVCFFSQTTFEWLASQWQAEVIFIDKDVIIFQKKHQ